MNKTPYNEEQARAGRRVYIFTVCPIDVVVLHTFNAQAFVVPGGMSKARAVEFGELFHNADDGWKEPEVWRPLSEEEVARLKNLSFGKRTEVAKYIRFDGTHLVVFNFGHLSSRYTTTKPADFFLTFPAVTRVPLDLADLPRRPFWLKRRDDRILPVRDLAPVTRLEWCRAGVHLSETLDGPWRPAWKEE